MEYDPNIHTPENIKQLVASSPINNFNTRFYFDPEKKDIKNVFKPSIFKNTKRSACFQFLRYAPLNTHGKRQVKEGNVYLYFRLRTKQYEKYLDLVQELVNKITPCRYYVENTMINNKPYKLICFKYELLPTYSENLFVGDIIRPLWFSINNYFGTGKGGTLNFYKELKKYIKDNPDYDPVTAICECIKSSITTANQSRIYWSDHSFFTHKVKTKTLKDFKDTFKNGSTRYNVQGFLDK